MNTRGLLYTAFHKFYNALSSLENFEKGQNFFDNINCLDNFFSEYRNITFVLQKSLAHTEYKTTYENIRDKYLVNDVGRWFIDKRNEVLKQNPFELEKRILITIYSSEDTLMLPELIYTIDNDVKISTIIKSLHNKLTDFGHLEVMFSTEFAFFEKGKTDELYENLIFGIDQMKLFLSEMQKTLNEECNLTNELEKKIKNLNFYRVPKDMLFIDDYVFYTKNEIFEKASRIAVSLGDTKVKVPIENINKIYPDGDLFNKFELMHLVTYQMQKTILPTCLILYNDDTFELISFGFSLKTTVYRKFNEIAKRIQSDDINSIYFVNEMYIYNKNDIINLNSRERIKYAKSEMLTFYMVDKNLQIKSRMYDVLKIDDFKYITSKMYGELNVEKLPSFMNPIVQKFTELKVNLK